MKPFNNLFSLAEVKKVICVEKDFITKAIFHLPEYFSESAKPRKGTERKFTLDDISTLAYISFNWEDNVDYESLKTGLNKGEQFELPFDQYYFDLIPIIRNDFENIDSESARYIFFNRAIFQANFE